MARAVAKGPRVGLLGAGGFVPDLLRDFHVIEGPHDFVAGWFHTGGASEWRALILGLGWKLSATDLAFMPELRHIVVLGSNPGAAVDLGAAATRGVRVDGVERYCDHETAEWIMGRLAGFFRFGVPFGEPGRSLYDLHMGILGLGAVGWRLARMGAAFGMHVGFFNPTPRPERENERVHAFTDPVALAKRSSILSVCVREDARDAVDEGIFGALGPGSVFVSTSKGRIFDPRVFKRWIAQPERFALFDEVGGRIVRDLKGLPEDRVFVDPLPAYRTPSSMAALRRKAQEIVLGGF